MRTSHDPRALAVALTILAGVLALRPAAAEPTAWRVDLGAGVGSDYVYRTYDYFDRTYHERFGPGPAILASVARPVAPGVSLALDVGWLFYQEELFFVSIPEDPPPSGRLRAHVVPIALGARLEPRLEGLTPFLQAAPAVFVVRLVERIERPAVGMSGRPAEVRQASTVRAAPGVILGAGVRTRIAGRLGFMTSFRYLLSADLGEITVGSSSGAFDRINQLAVTTGLSLGR